MTPKTLISAAIAGLALGFLAGCDAEIAEHYQRLDNDPEVTAETQFIVFSTDAFPIVKSETGWIVKVPREGKRVACDSDTYEGCETALKDWMTAPADDSAASSPSSSAAPATAPAAQPGSALAVPVGTVAYGGTSYQMIGGHKWAVKVGNSYVPCDSNSAQGCSAALSAHLGNQPKQPSPLDDDDGGGNGR